MKKEQSKDKELSSLDPFKLELEADLQNLPIFLEAATKLAKSIGFKKHCLMHIELILEEIIVNIISYAYENKKNGNIILEGNAVGNNTLQLKIIDFGIPFNLLEAKDPDIELPIEERDAGGLGIFLVKHLVNDIKYERKDNKNILTLIKHIENGE